MAEYIRREAAISLIKQYGLDAIDGGRYSVQQKEQSAFQFLPPLRSDYGRKGGCL